MYTKSNRLLEEGQNTPFGPQPLHNADGPPLRDVFEKARCDGFFLLEIVVADSTSKKVDDGLCVI